MIFIYQKLFKILSNMVLIRLGHMLLFGLYLPFDDKGIMMIFHDPSIVIFT